ncbi:phosphoenolpyruvate carboxykinase (ATP) [Actibacterium sp. MT2.3-13A]|uniref:phosphoenolpyruvate carboxykinase (ATP) n=1 Tax=Actibacterium sp. MT2.3-13A TaxID=2828332 RepID=UPI001BA66069|nr:phosphoenolpyruvate carboxykinase (ATP) [Actibacterium sp. MT2.3-13A]
MIETGTWNPHSGLAAQGISTRSARYNASNAVLLETALARKEGLLTAQGALAVNTGKFTGRSPKDKHIVAEPETEADIWWDGNSRMSPVHFERMKKDIFDYLRERNVEVQDLVCGAVAEHSVNIRLVADYTWHALFLRHMLRRPDRAALEEYVPDFTIINVPDFLADPERHGCRSETCIALSFEQRLVLIAGTEYSGENKKSAFTILNHLYPERGIMPMHCSANHAIEDPSDTALFFGLSGTGKTTLSADPNRALIGDDEHGWFDDGVFNFEGGCYAKTIRLSQEAEPDIWAAVHSCGTVLENVVVDARTREIDFDDASLTENTRAAYPLSVLPNANVDSRGGTPRNIFLLTCDAFGVTPPIARLTPKEARALFLLGFTSKVSGTERGVTEPEPTFSTCFGAPFLTRAPHVYADLFERRLADCGANVWLVNTGWSGGNARTGNRMPIRVTRRLLNAAMAGLLDRSDYVKDPVWGLSIPTSGPEETIPFLNPEETWRDRAAFWESAGQLRDRILPRLAALKIEGLMDRARPLATAVEKAEHE